jgi:hypothetical protein
VLATEYDQWGSSTLHVKLGLVALVAALIVWHMLRVSDGAIFAASLAVVWLGVMRRTSPMRERTLFG